MNEKKYCPFLEQTECDNWCGLFVPNHAGFPKGFCALKRVSYFLKKISDSVELLAKNNNKKKQEIDKDQSF